MKPRLYVAFRIGKWSEYLATIFKFVKFLVDYSLPCKLRAYFRMKDLTSGSIFQSHSLLAMVMWMGMVITTVMIMAMMMILTKKICSVWMSLMEALCSCINYPLKNIMNISRLIYNAAKSFKRLRHTN